MSYVALDFSLSKIAPYGRFLEIGKKDINATSDSSMRALVRGAAFVSLDVSRKIYHMSCEIISC